MKKLILLASAMILPGSALSAATLPADTLIPVTTSSEISSIKMKEGDTHMMQIATDVAEDGRVVIPRGAPVLATVTLAHRQGHRRQEREVRADLQHGHGTRHEVCSKGQISRRRSGQHRRRPARCDGYHRQVGNDPAWAGRQRLHRRSNTGFLRCRSAPSAWRLSARIIRTSAGPAGAWKS